MHHPVVFETLGPHHDIADFTCSNELFVHYLMRQAGQDVRRRSATVIVARDSDRNTVAGYYTISAFGIALEGLPSDLRKRLPRYPVVPAVLVGRLAVDTRCQGQGVGGLLLVDAIARAADLEVAVWGVVVDAIDASAVRFYEHFWIHVAHGYAKPAGAADRHLPQSASGRRRVMCDHTARYGLRLNASPWQNGEGKTQ